MPQGWTVDEAADTITFQEAPPTGVNNVVVKEYDATTVGGTDAWALGAWSSDNGWPSEVEYFSDRLWFAGTPRDPQTLWASNIGDYSNFGKSTPIVDSDAITSTINARQVNAVRDLVPLDKLLVLTTGAEFLGTGGQDDVYTPTTFALKPQSYRGISTLQAKVVGDTAVFVQEQGQRVFDIGYRFEQDGYRPQDISVWAEHLVENRVLLQLEWMPAPWSLLWFVRDDGVALGCTYMPEQEVIGWHWHDTGRDINELGDDEIIDIACLPGTRQTEVYALVRRVVDGATVTYLEQMADAKPDDVRDWFYLDSGLTYDGRNTSATTLTLSGGTDWLETETLTLTASAVTGINGDTGFAATDVGDGFTLERVVTSTDPETGERVDTTYKVTLQIVSRSSTTVVEVQSIGTVPEQLRNVAITDWVFLRDRITGLGHLEGREVVILADASVHPVRTVENGSITLDAPYGVVHVGLRYTALLRTLQINAVGGPTIRDEKKMVTEVSLEVKDTVGLKAGTKLDHIDDIAWRETEDWGEPTRPKTGIVKALTSAQWGEDEGQFYIVSDDPLPAEILRLIPKTIP